MSSFQKELSDLASNEHVPTAIRSGKVKLSDKHTIIFHVLDDGSRIMDESGLEIFLDWLESAGEAGNSAEKLARAIKLGEFDD